MSTDFRKWVCDACGYIYEEEKGDPDSGLAPGTKYEDIPNDWMCPLCGLTKSDLRLLPDAPSPSVKPVVRNKTTTGKCKGGDDYVVIIGAGIAAWSVAEEIRRNDPQTPVLMVTSCEGLSYPKPALSTALANGKSAGDLVDNDGLSKAEELNIDIRTETRVIKIDTKKKRLTTAKGGIQYHKLVIAIGAHQRELPINGNASSSIMRVNDLAAYRKFRKRLAENVQHVTILGGGLIGCEFAEDLISSGYKVSIIDPAEYPMANLLPEKTGHQLQQRLAEKGVSWLFKTTVDSVEQSGAHLRAILSDGVAIETDMVLSAAGLVANTQLAAKAGLPVNQGIIVDRQMRSLDADIYALGDCAEVEGKLFSYIEPIRRQAAVIASNLRNVEKSFELKSPLVRVKTPSYPLTICPPEGTQNFDFDTVVDESGDRTDYLVDHELVGFVLSGETSKQGSVLYKEIHG